jgi:hypothetical protein
MSHCGLPGPIPPSVHQKGAWNLFLPCRVEFHMFTSAMLCECYGVVIGFDDGEASQAGQ